MFNPMLAGVEDVGFHEKIFNTLTTCDIDNFIPLIQNIMLTGGTTMFPGLSTRMTMEIENIMCERKYGGNLR